MAGIGVSAGVAEARVGNAGGRRAAACVIGEPKKEAGRGGMTRVWGEKERVECAGLEREGGCSA